MTGLLPQAIAISIGFVLLACGSPPAPAAATAPPPQPESELSFEPPGEPAPPSAGGAVSVQAGSYQLRLTATCPDRERTANGKLTLKRISAAQLPGAPSSELESTERLLWGQTDLDVE